MKYAAKWYQRVTAIVLLAILLAFAGVPISHARAEEGDAKESLPESFDLRDVDGHCYVTPVKLLKNGPRCTMLCGDALDGAWTACIPKGSMVVVCVEGVLEYFTKKQTAACLHALCDSFDHGYLVAEMNSMASVERARQTSPQKNKVPLQVGHTIWQGVRRDRAAPVLAF